MEQELTVRQRQRVGARMARYSREIDEKIASRHHRLREILLDLVTEAYIDGFSDGVKTEREEQSRKSRKPKY